MANIITNFVFQQTQQFQGIVRPFFLKAEIFQVAGLAIKHALSCFKKIAVLLILGKNSLALGDSLVTSLVGGVALLGGILRFRRKLVAFAAQLFVLSSGSITGTESTLMFFSQGVNLFAEGVALFGGFLGFLGEFSGSSFVLITFGDQASVGLTGLGVSLGGYFELFFKILGLEEIHLQLLLHQMQLLQGELGFFAGRLQLLI